EMRVSIAAPAAAAKINSRRVVMVDLPCLILRSQQPQGCGGLSGEQQPERGAVGLGLVAPCGAWPQAQQGADAPLEDKGRRKKQHVRRRGDAPGLRRGHELRE